MNLIITLNIFRFYHISKKIYTIFFKVLSESIEMAHTALYTLNIFQYSVLFNSYEKVW